MRKNGLLLTLALVLTLLCAPKGWAAGGPSGTMSRMETMVSQLEQSGELNAEQAEQYREKIKTLRQKVEARIEKNGGFINTKGDSDIYGEIDGVNKPLFDLYQRSQAKKENPKASLGYPKQQNPNNSTPTGQRKDQNQNRVKAGSRK